jgi:hypothetical protein
MQPAMPSKRPPWGCVSRCEPVSTARGKPGSVPSRRPIQVARLIEARRYTASRSQPARSRAAGDVLRREGQAVSCRRYLAGLPFRLGGRSAPRCARRYEVLQHILRWVPPSVLVKQSLQILVDGACPLCDNQVAVVR